MTQLSQQLQQQLQEQAKSHADVSSQCRQLKQDLNAALSDKHSAAEQFAGLQNQLASITAKLNSAEETHSSDLTQAESKFAKQQHRSQAAVNSFKQELQMLRNRLASKAKQPSTQAASTQASAHSSNVGSQAGSGMQSSQCQDAELAMQVKTLQVCSQLINFLLDTAVIKMLHLLLPV